MEKKKNLNTDDLLNMPLDDLVKMNQNKNKQRNNFNKNRNTNRFYNNNQRYQSNYRYNNRDNRRYYNNYNDRRHEPFNKFDHVDRNKQRDTRTRLFITNLHRGVTNQELQKLFGAKGKLKRCGVIYDKMGKSTGTADIEYERAEDAKEAINAFNNAEIDRVPLTVAYKDEREKKSINNKRLFHHSLKYNKK